MKNKIVKRILIAAIAAAIAVGGITGGVRYQRGNRTAEVYAVSDLSDSYWGDEVYSSGQVTNDYSQIVYVPKTDTIREVFVEEGQQVRIGDKLVELDTRASELEYNMKVLEVENLENQIQLAENDLKKWKSMKPGTSRSSGEIVPMPNGAAAGRQYAVRLNEGPEKTGDAYNFISASAIPYNQEEADGSPENPYRYLCTEDAYVTGEVIRALAETKQCAVFEIYENNTISEEGPKSGWTIDGRQVAIPDKDSKWSVASRTQIKTDDKEENNTESQNPKPQEDTASPQTESDPRSDEDERKEDDSEQDEMQKDDFSDLDNEDGFADLSEDGFADLSEDGYDDFVDDGYTKEEIQEQIEDCEQKLKELDLSKRKAELEVEKLKAKSSDGIIYATVNGVIKNLKDAEEREDDTAPFMEVSGSEGLYVTGAISELLLDQVEPGQEVQVYSWETGISCDAQITEIFDYPASDADAYGGDGNSNVSYYPYTAYIEETAGLQNGEYVDLTMTVGGGAGENAIYLPKAYVRTENGQSYVYKVDENDRLVKQYVKTGRTIYGYSVEVKSGISMDDRIAFPYGKTAKEGIRAVDADSENY